jgi:hypothetical protein
MIRLIGLAALVPALAIAAPTTLTSQGRLIDTAGSPINGDRTLTFSLYTDEAGSSAALWSENNPVSVTDGYYSVVLGDDSAFPSSVLNATSLYLGISVDSAADLRPREAVTSSLFAMRADTAVNVDGGTVNATEITVGDFILDSTGLSADGVLVVDADGLVTNADWDNVTAIVRQDYTVQPSLVLVELPGSQGPGIPFEGYAHRSVSVGGTGCFNWVRTTPEAIDASQNYEFSIWMRSDSLDMDNYFGFHVYDENMDRISTAGMSNPYFKTGENDSGWTRWTGRLLHHGTPDSGDNGSPDSGIPETNGTDYVMPPNAAYAEMRYGSCYSPTVDATSDFALPNMILVETPPVSDMQVDSTTRNFSTTWAAGATFNTVEGFRAGSKIRLTYHVPMRNDSTSWGGGYIEPQIRINGGTWQSLGSSGYDGGVMNNTSPSIGSYGNTLLIDPAQTNDFTVQTRFYHRAYDGTVKVNGSHDVNNVSGTGSLMSGINSSQHYTNVLVEEVR